MCVVGFCCFREGWLRLCFVYCEVIVKVIVKDYVVRGSYMYKEDGSERLRGEEEV